MYYFQGYYDKAINYYTKSLKIKEEIDDKEGMSSSYNNIGAIYQFQGDYPKAITFHTKSLKINEEIGDKEGMSSSYNNIGIIYKNQGDYDNAITYHTKSLKISEEIGDKKGIASSLNNIGNIYIDQEDYEKAMEYHTKGLKIKEEIGDKYGMSGSLINIGAIYKNQGDYKNAISNYIKSLEIAEQIGNKQRIAFSLNSIALIYKEQGNYQKALTYSSKALKIAQDVGIVIIQKNASKVLWSTNKKIGNYKAALEMHELYITMRDSILSEESQNAVIKQQYKYEYEKQAAVDSIAHQKEKEILDANIQKQELEIKTKKQQQYLLFGGLTLLGIFGIFMYNRFKVTQKQKTVIETQKQIVEEQKTAVETQKQELQIVHEQLSEHHQEISDSIKYAERLQLAILPPKEDMKKNLGDSFVLFKPKDVVSGDFYWLQQSGDITFFAAADCTGHGVPGAMVSVVCSNALNRSVKEFGLTQPKDILNKTRELVIETFARSGKDVKDGMDIALCAKTQNQLIFAGANNPLWIVRKTEHLTPVQKEERSTIIEDNLALVEYKGNKQPIGLYESMKDFTQQEVPLYPNDTLYIFTDGFADQFGGEKGKKLKYKPFKKHLIEINNQTMEAQRSTILKTFTNWKGDIEQVDDVCIIGVKL